MSGMLGIAKNQSEISVSRIIRFCSHRNPGPAKPGTKEKDHGFLRISGMGTGQSKIVSAAGNVDSSFES